MTQDTQKCPLSVLTSVRTKQVNFRENVSHIVKEPSVPLYKLTEDKV